MLFKKDWGKNKNKKMNNKIGRLERLSLAESRDKKYEKFYRNLRILHGSSNLSGTDLAKKLGLKNGARFLALQYGRGNPTIEELIAICNHFKISLDDIMSKEAKIKFE